MSGILSWIFVTDPKHEVTEEKFKEAATVGAVKARPSSATPRLDGAIVFVDIGCLVKQDARRHQRCSLAPAVLQAELRIL